MSHAAPGRPKQVTIPLGERSMVTSNEGLQ